MAITKGAGTAVLSAVTSTQTSSAVTTSGDYADTLFISIVQVGTATGAATVQVLESPDGGTTYYAAPTKLVTAGLLAGTYQSLIALDPTTTKAKVTFTAQTGGSSSTCTVQLNNVTGI
jgi:hypothetical protein